MMERWLAASLHLADGRIVRFGPDEQDIGDVPTAVSFDTNNPGGFGSGSITLPRPENLYEDDAKLFSHVELYGPGNVTLYEGLVIGVPQVDRDSIQLQLAGWVSVLDRHQTFRAIFVDRDLSRWETVNATRHYNLLMVSNNAVQDDLSVVTDDSSYPVLRMTLTAPWTSAIRNEAIYDATPLEIESVYFDYTSSSDAASQPSANFHYEVGTGDDPTAFVNFTGTGDLHTAIADSDSGTHTADPGHKAARVVWYYAAANTADGVVYTADTGPLAVFGNHGLTKRGTAPDQGYYASDVVTYAIGKCPSLSIGADSVETTSFVIPHLVFDTDTTLRSVIEQVTALGGNQNVANDWGVYDNREFYWRSPGTYGRTWYVRRDEVAETAADGPDADRRVAGVKVNYQDPAGASKSVGPPGSDADYETTELLDIDPDNPAHRIAGAFASESVGITTQGGAVNIGVMILNERNRLDWRGSVTVTGEATDQYGNTYPAALIRAGDRIVVSDTDNPTERTIVSTSYSHDSLSVTCDIGATPDSLEALLGQLALVTDRIG